MRISGDWLRRQIACSLMILLTVPFGEAAAARRQATAPQDSAASQNSGASQESGSTTPSSQPAADSPHPPTSLDVPQGGAPATGLDTTHPQSANPNSSAGAAAPNASQSVAAEPANPEPQPAIPVGTAAAPYTRPTGIAASRPAGAVIAPAKQRRTRSILIKVGVIVGAGIAVGTVAALSLSGASHSRP